VGWVLVIPCMAGAQQGLKGSGLRGRGGYPCKLWDQLQDEVQHRLVRLMAGILVVIGPAAQPRDMYSGMV
jgi:hypothetical protein